MSLQDPMGSWPKMAPLGAASPLWAAHMGAAGAGVAFWWMTRWMQPANLEALFGREAAIKALEFQAAVEEPMLEVAEALVEAEEAAEVAAIEAESAIEAPARQPATNGLSPTAKALIARRKAAASARASKPA